MKGCNIKGCGRKHRARGWCNTHYMRWLNHGDPNHVQQVRDIITQEVFEDKTMPVTETGCIIWLDSPTKAGYGLVFVGGKNVLIHRHVWEQTNNQKIPGGMYIDHKCHTTVCCNPDHLRLATNAQNGANRKGRNKNNASGHLNISWNKVCSKWQVTVKRLHYGYFDTIEDAIPVRDRARKELYGVFA